MAALTPRDDLIGIVGAGAMGSGIAQVAAQAGHRVVLLDAHAGVAQKGLDAIAAALGKLVAKGKLAAAEREATLARITVAETLPDIAPAALVIEAIVEDLTAKRELFERLEVVCGEATILATNTSSLSITAIGAGLQRPQRFAGLHFFNPAPLMALVEVVSGLATDEAVARTLLDTAAAWGKVPVACRSTPGFIVNRVARPFYAEGLRLLQEGAADAATIDAVLREAGGFRMGPFELTDLIGQDVNFAVTRSVHAAFFGDPRFQPSLVQQELVEAGRLGRKSGQGFYDYAPGSVPPEPARLPPSPPPRAIIIEGDLGPAEPLAALAAEKGIAVGREDAKGEGGGKAGAGLIRLDGGGTLMPTDGRMATEVAATRGIDDLVVFDLVLNWRTATRIALAPASGASVATFAAAGFFQALGIAVSPFGDLPGLAVARTVAMLANEAADAVHQGVADAADIDLAMTKGVNYPLGPLAWAEAIGLRRVMTILDNLARSYGEDRYRASLLLRRHVLGGTRFHG